MTGVLADRSFNTNLAVLLIGALMLMVVGLTSGMVRNTTTAMNAEHMVMVRGSGWGGTTLLVVGLAVAVIGVAAVVTGGAVIVALAAANVTAGAAGAAMVVNVGLYAAGGGAATAAVGATWNWLEGR